MKEKLSNLTKIFIGIAMIDALVVFIAFVLGFYTVALLLGVIGIIELITGIGIGLYVEEVL